MPSSVTLIQQLLANRSRASFADGASVAKSPDDLAAAEAYYQRQSGVKEVRDASGRRYECFAEGRSLE